jgi:hypothetical protein
MASVRHHRWADLSSICHLCSGGLVVTRLWDGLKEFDSWQFIETGFFSLCHPIQIGWGVHPAYSPVDNRDPSPGVGWPGHEADHSPPYIFTLWCFVNHRNSFTCAQPMSPCGELSHRSPLSIQGLVTLVLIFVVGPFVFTNCVVHVNTT